MVFITNFPHFLFRDGGGGLKQLWTTRFNCFVIQFPNMAIPKIFGIKMTDFQTTVLYAILKS